MTMITTNGRRSGTRPGYPLRSPGLSQGGACASSDRVVLWPDPPSGYGLRGTCLPAPAPRIPPRPRLSLHVSGCLHGRVPVMGMTTSRRPAMRGRRGEWKTILAAVRHAEAGGSGILLVEGGHGIGKSRLLTEAVKAASGRDFSIAASSADELGHLMPLGPLRAAFAEPWGTPAEVGSLTDAPDQRMRLVARLRARLEERAAAHPVLVSLDDLHWADPPTLLALRTLPRQLASYPVIWILA